MTKVRCKFKLTQIIQFAGMASKYIFEPYCDDKIPDDEKFCKYTPSGRFEMSIDNPPAQAMFKIGEFYYFDATPVLGADAAAF